MTDPFVPSAGDLLRWAETLSGIARTGLAFTQSLYEQERFEEVLKVAADIRASAIEEAEAETLFDEWLASIGEGVHGYVTPKVAVAAIVGNEQGELLLTQRADSGVWLYPVGYADVGYSPSEIAVKEVYEETGIEVEPVSLIAVLDGLRLGFAQLPAVLAAVPLPHVRRRAARPSARDAARSASSHATTCRGRSPASSVGVSSRSRRSTASSVPATSTRPAPRPGGATTTAFAAGESRRRGARLTPPCATGQRSPAASARSIVKRACSSMPASARARWGRPTAAVDDAHRVLDDRAALAEVARTT